MHDFLIQSIANYPLAIYGFIILAAAAEGPILSIFCGVLLRIGYFYFFPLYVALMFGDLLGDAIWYYIGLKFGNGFIRRFGKYFNITEKRVLIAEKIFHRYKDSILFISKISNGLGLAIVVQVAAGMVRIPFGRYILVNLSGQFIWSALLMGIGYFFSHLYVELDTFLGRSSVITLFILFIVLFMGFRNYARSKVEEYA